MRKLNQSGFGAIETILVVVIIGIIGFTGWWVWSSKNKTNTSFNNTGNSHTYAPKAAQKPVIKDETQDWYLYKSPGGEYQMRLPDGWSLERNMSDSAIYAISGSDINYKKGQPAIVTEVEGGKDFGTIAFFLTYVNVKTDSSGPTPGTKQPSFKTNTGLTVDKYYYVVPTDPEGLGAPKGTKQYFYNVSNGDYKISIQHDIKIGESEDLTYLEKSIKTIVFL